MRVDDAPFDAEPRVVTGLSRRETEVMELIATGQLQRADRPAPVSQRENREEPCKPDIRQTRRGLAGHRDRPLAGASRPRGAAALPGRETTSKLTGSSGFQAEGDLRAER